MNIVIELRYPLYDPITGEVTHQPGERWAPNDPELIQLIARHGAGTNWEPVVIVQ
jgi:hypothetical protein